MDIVSFKEELAKYKKIPNEKYVLLTYTNMHNNLYKGYIVCGKITSPPFYVLQSRLKGLEANKLIPVEEYIKVYEEHLKKGVKKDENIKRLFIKED